MLDPNPLTRATAQECLDHPYLSSEVDLEEHGLYPVIAPDNLNLRMCSYEQLVDMTLEHADLFQRL